MSQEGGVTVGYLNLIQQRIAGNISPGKEKRYDSKNKERNSSGNPERKSVSGSSAV